MFDALTNSTVLLAFGGITAAVVTGWQHVKGFFNYISSAIIITVNFDTDISNAVINYLELNYKNAPSGIFYINSVYYRLKNNQYSTIVPFIVNSNSSIRYKGLQVLFISGTYEKLIVRSIRGLFDAKKFLITALLYYEQKQKDLNKQLDYDNRFIIRKIVGREKGFIPREAYAESKPLKNEIKNENNSYPIIPGITKSFMYKEEEYLFASYEDPFKNLYFNDDIINYINQSQQWFDMGQWYTDRGIPWRRGWLLHGLPGSGKSSLAKAVALKLKIPIYQFFLNTLSDQEFIEHWNDMYKPCVALFEDFDTVFNKRKSLTAHEALSFDCIINTISGIDTSSGVFLIVTTNSLDSIDEAMGIAIGHDGISTRPGRIDTVIELGYISKENRYKMASNILKDWPDIIPNIVENNDNCTPVQFSEMCIQYAFQIMADPTNIKLPKFCLTKNYHYASTDKLYK